MKIIVLEYNQTKFEAKLNENIIAFHQFEVWEQKLCFKGKYLPKPHMG